MRFEDQRDIMVQEQLLARGISDIKVINAFLKVPRELFVTEKWLEFTYMDHPLQIGCEQTISQPYMVAVMMELLELQSTDKVLEIGTGCGYVTALLAEIVAEVYTIERLDELMKNAKINLKKMNYQNIYFKIGDGSLGWVKALPNTTEFDKIIVSAGSPGVPNQLLTQLKDGGKLVIPQGTKKFQELFVYEKKNGEIISNAHCTCVFVPLIGEDGWSSEN